jgi:hypothetical protein
MATCDDSQHGECVWDLCLPWRLEEIVIDPAQFFQEADRSLWQG